MTPGLLKSANKMVKLYRQFVKDPTLANKL